MTAYWDEKESRVRELSEGTQDFEVFLTKVTALEHEVITTVTLTTGDRDFPETLRERILNIISRYAVDYEYHLERGHKPTKRRLPINLEAQDWLYIMRSSRLITELHSEFHRVAVGRHPHRFQGGSLTIRLGFFACGTRVYNFARA